MANHIANKLSINFLPLLKGSIWAYGGNIMPRVNWIANKFRKSLHKKGW